jgi:hypothetical protein
VIAAIVSGILFALGLALSGMASPAKVTAFLDVTGSWDPTLAFVMAGAIAIHVPVVRWAKRRAAPLHDTRFHWPSQTAIDLRLIAGAAIFGVGWGLSGYCPGPALVSLGRFWTGTLLFVGALIAGIAVTRWALRRR